MILAGILGHRLQVLLQRVDPPHAQVALGLLLAQRSEAGNMLLYNQLTGPLKN
jgi:hypothetical protein